jgi:hypothetical protein
MKRHRDRSRSRDRNPRRRSPDSSKRHEERRFARREEGSRQSRDGFTDSDATARHDPRAREHPDRRTQGRHHSDHHHHRGSQPLSSVPKVSSFRQDNQSSCYNPKDGDYRHDSQPSRASGSVCIQSTEYNERTEAAWAEDCFEARETG